MEPRLKSSLWVAAYLRRCFTLNLNGVVARKGDETAGSVIIKINLLDGRARVFEAAYDDKGARIWIAGLKEDPAAEPEVDAYIERASKRDPDLWVVEIENRTGEPHLEGF